MLKNKEKIKEFIIDHTPLFLFKIKIKIRSAAYAIKYFFQRGFRGYDDRAWFDIDYWFMETMAKLLRKMAKDGSGFPLEFKERNEWVAILNRMAAYLDKMNYEEEFDKCYNETDDVTKAWEMADTIINERKEKFFKLFSDYFYNLWD